MKTDILLGLSWNKNSVSLNQKIFTFFKEHERFEKQSLQSFNTWTWLVTHMTHWELTLTSFISSLFEHFWSITEY